MHPVYRRSPPPPPLPAPPAKKKFCITIVFDSSLDECNTQDKLKTIIKQNFLFSGGGGGGDLCENGDSTHERETHQMECNAVHWLALVCGIKKEIGKKKKILHTWFYYINFAKK